jgi:hypothetical protein
MTIETWAQIKRRQEAERLAILDVLASAGLTQSEAARALDMELTALNNVIRRSGMTWPYPKQGMRSRPRDEVRKIAETAINKWKEHGI